MTAELEVRRATGADQDQILALAARSLGWAGDERDRAFFEWKHQANPFGASPAWVAGADGEVVGFRTMLRWELVGAERVRRVVRAVDTATDPAHQGKGIFRRLTLLAVEELQAAGVDAVFNTPNRQSRPGYLKMGWHQLGRPSLSVVPRSPAAVVALARSRAAAGKWGEAVDVGDPAPTAFDDAQGLDLVALCAALPPPSGMATPRTPEYLRWRYGLEPLGYRVIEVRGGVCVFRVRNRGGHREVSICEWLSPSPDPRAVRRLVRACGDVGIGIGLGLRRHGALPVPRQGPIVTWRPLADGHVPALGDLCLGMGDLELF
jgi:GNAT superfamily N-acetyltransferase